MKLGWGFDINLGENKTNVPSLWRVASAAVDALPALLGRAFGVWAADAAVDAALLERAFGAGAADASVDAALLERAFGIGAADAVVDVVQFCAHRRSGLKRL